MKSQLAKYVANQLGLIKSTFTIILNPFVRIAVQVLTAHGKMSIMRHEWQMASLTKYIRGDKMHANFHHLRKISNSIGG